MPLVIVVGKGHSGTRSIAFTLKNSGVYIWKYCIDMVNNTPMPKNFIRVRFEDFVLDNNEQIKILEDFLGIKLTSVPVRRESIGRWKTSNEYKKLSHTVSFLSDTLLRMGYNDSEWRI